MHILIGFITAVAGLLWALHSLQRSGLDLNSFNPFYWARRRKWQKQFGTKPLHSLESSMEAAAALIVATGKLDGDLTREQKQRILGLFTDEFKLAEADAQSLFVSTCHVLNEATDITAEARHILAPSLATFSDSQKASLMGMLNAIAAEDGPATPTQKSLIEAVNEQLYSDTKNGDW